MSVVEDIRKAFQDSLAPELRSISVRMDSLEKQRVEDMADLLRAIAESKSDTMRVITESKNDMLRVIAEGNAHMEKPFELVIDYTKVLQRMDRLEEAKQAEQH